MRAAPTWQVWTALGIVYVIWGSTYFAIRYLVDSLPPLLSASTRFLLAAGLLAGFLLGTRGRRALAATGRQYVNAVLIGSLLLLGGNGGVTLAEQRGLPTGLASLLIAAVPLWVVLLRLLARDRPAGWTLVGVAIGFAGLAVLLRPGARPADVSTLAVVLVIGSGLLWALGSFLAPRTDLPADPLVAAVVEMLGGAVGLAVVGLLRHETLHPAEVRLSSVLALAYLVVFGSLVAFTAYSWLLGVASASKASTYAYVNPVVAVLLGSVFLGEHVTGTSLVGGGLTLLAVAVVVSEEGRRRGRPLASPVEVPPQTPDELQGRDLSSAT